MTTHGLKIPNLRIGNTPWLGRGKISICLALAPSICSLGARFLRALALWFGPLGAFTSSSHLCLSSSYRMSTNKPHTTIKSISHKQEFLVLDYESSIQVQNMAQTVPQVVNIKNFKNIDRWESRHPDRVYIGRPNKQHVTNGSIWANNFSLQKFGREGAINMYRRWLYDMISRDPEKYNLKSLRGKIIGCWCVPKHCHGHVLQEAVNEQIQQELYERNNKAKPTTNQTRNLWDSDDIGDDSWICTPTEQANDARGGPSHDNSWEQPTSYQTNSSWEQPLNNRDREAKDNPAQLFPKPSHNSERLGDTVRRLGHALESLEIIMMDMVSKQKQILEHLSHAGMVLRAASLEDAKHTNNRKRTPTSPGESR